GGVGQLDLVLEAIERTATAGDLALRSGQIERDRCAKAELGGPAEHVLGPDLKPGMRIPDVARDLGRFEEIERMVGLEGAPGVAYAEALHQEARLVFGR